MSPPKVNELPVPVLTDFQLRALLATCIGKTFTNLRDTAIMWLFIDTGARCGEIAPLTVDDLDFEMDVAHVMGKGRRARPTPFGTRTGEALRRYLRARSRQPAVALPPRIARLSARSASVRNHVIRSPRGAHRWTTARRARC